MITVLRIGHRPGRDKRVTTHVALVARAFGADKIFVDSRDERIEKNIKSVSKRFGEGLEIETGADCKKKLREWDGFSVHLTMYGESLNKSMEVLPEDKDLLVVVGAEKVPSHVYQMVDYNVSVGNQPHSEIAALAVFLDRYTKGKWLHKRFQGEMEIIPDKRGKKVLSGNSVDEEK